MPEAKSMGEPSSSSHLLLLSVWTTDIAADSRASVRSTTTTTPERSVEKAFFKPPAPDLLLSVRTPPYVASLALSSVCGDAGVPPPGFPGCEKQVMSFESRQRRPPRTRPRVCLACYESDGGSCIRLTSRLSR